MLIKKKAEKVGNQMKFIGAELLQAINKQIEELGWNK